MNWINQLNRFYGSLQTNTMTSNAITLYGLLLYLNNRCGWKREFTVANQTLQGLASLSRSQLYKAWNELKLHGFIDYKKGQEINPEAICLFVWIHK